MANTSFVSYADLTGLGAVKFPESISTATTTQTTVLLYGDD